MVNVDVINAWSQPEAVAAFLRCCGARRWAEHMAARRPYAGEAELLAAAEEVWWSLPSTDWLEAFTAHPRIGDLESLHRQLAPTAAWAAAEQAGVQTAPEADRRALADGNRQYEARFGHRFIVCASGKSADEMLALLRQRLGNRPEDELRIAAGEQSKITRLRLQKL